MEELKEGWRRVRLSEVINFNPKETLKKNTVAKYIEMANLQCFSRNILGYEEKEYRGGTKFRNGDTLLARITPCLENGKTAYINCLEKNEVAFGSTEYIILREKENISDKKFIYYLAISNEFRELAIKSMTGTSGRQRVQTDMLINSEINLPPLETQEKIASILSALDDKIEINNEMNKTLEEMAQTLFKRWFIDFDFPNENGEPYRSSGGKMVDSELGEIPEGWEVTKIENVVNIKRGASPRPIQDYISDDGIPWIKISDATSSISKFLNKTNEFIIEKGKEKSRFIERGTLILSNSATPGIPMIVNLDACVHDGWLIFNEYKNITKEFLYYVLKYHKENILALSNGSVFRNLKTDILKNYKIILPNLDLIILFNQSLEIIDKYIRNNVEEIQSLTEIRDTLLPKLMSGEIDM